MIKLSFCLVRLPHLTRSEFQRYWRERHAPLVARHAETLGILRYVQTHTAETPMNAAIAAPRAAPAEFDGIAELWFASLEAMAKNGERAEARAAGAELLADEKTFIDLSRSPLWLSHEHEIVPTRR